MPSQLKAIYDRAVYGGGPTPLLYSLEFRRGDSTMSWFASGFVKAITISSTNKLITRGEKLILLILADYHNSERNYADPSINRLAEEGLYERRQVMRIVDSLEEKGFITTQKEVNRNTRYYITGLPDSTVTKCHHPSKRTVTKDHSDSDKDSDILPSKMSPEPIRTIEPIKTTNTPLSLFDSLSSNPEEPISPTKKEKQAKEKFVLPDWLPIAEWDGWLEMRKHMRKPATALAQKYAVEELDVLRQSGGNVREIIRKAISKNWLAFYPVNGTNGNHAPPPEDALERERRKEAERRRV